MYVFCKAISKLKYIGHKERNIGKKDFDFENIARLIQFLMNKDFSVYFPLIFKVFENMYANSKRNISSMNFL